MLTKERETSGDCGDQWRCSLRNKKSERQVETGETSGGAHQGMRDKWRLRRLERLMRPVEVLTKDKKSERQMAKNTYSFLYWRDCGDQWRCSPRDE